MTMSRSLRRELACTLLVTGVLGGMLSVYGFIIDHRMFIGWFNAVFGTACVAVAVILLLIEASRKLR
jgi:hypothetical protein